MKNIDWNARLRNKGFWVYMVGVVVTLTQLLGVKVFPDNVKDIANVILGALTIMGVIIDNSTNGLSDSKGVE